MANTISTFTWSREKKSAVMQEFLRSMLVAREISEFREGVKYIDNPYSTVGTLTTNSPMTGDYTVPDITTTDDQLLVNKEAIYAFHIRDFESVFADYDLGMDQLRKAAYKLAEDIDKDLFTELSTNATNTVTQSGGFTAATVIPKLAEVSQYFLGYDNAVNGTYVVIDADQTPAFIEAGAGNGFSFADAVLNNGIFGSFMGHDVYVVRGTLPTNVAIAGVKKASTTGIGGAIKIEEKAVTGKTGMEFAAIEYHTSKLWNNNEDLVVNIDLT